MHALKQQHKSEAMLAYICVTFKGGLKVNEDWNYA